MKEIVVPSNREKEKKDERPNLKYLKNDKFMVFVIWVINSLVFCFKSFSKTQSLKDKIYYT